jgi:hypothetical protein
LISAPLTGNKETARWNRKLPARKIGLIDFLPNSLNERPRLWVCKIFHRSLRSQLARRHAGKIYGVEWERPSPPLSQLHTQATMQGF